MISEIEQHRLKGEMTQRYCLALVLLLLEKEYDRDPTVKKQALDILDAILSGFYEVQIQAEEEAMNKHPLFKPDSLLSKIIGNHPGMPDTPTVSSIKGDLTKMIEEVKESLTKVVETLGE